MKPTCFATKPEQHVVSRVAIVGSRGYQHLEKVREYVRGLPPGTLVVSGGCKDSPDVVAEEEAKLCGLPKPLIFKAEWTKYGRSAGFKRNRDIVWNCDRVVCFWNGESKGTKHDIDLAHEFGKPVEIILDCGGECDPPF